MQHPAENPAAGRGKPLDEGTLLALKRSAFAADRTLMAWIRTALSLISFGFTIVKFFQYVEQSRGPVVGLMGRTWSPKAVGLAMLTIGTVSLMLAVFEHWRTLKEFRSEGLESRWSLVLLVASLVAMLGMFALITLALGE
jgi:putative membrane protein